MDIDSTVQEANITYPSDAHLMVKLTLLAGKVWTYLKENLSYFADFTPTADVKAVKAKAKAHFFDARKDREQANATLLELWREAFSQVSPVTKYFDGLLNYDGQRLPWNIHRAWAQVQEHSSKLFLHIASFICQGVMVRDKPLSLHAQAVSCFNKGKLAKGLQFGRAFQLGRIEGNFLLAGWCSSIRMEDKTSLRPMIVEHQHLFGKGILKSLGTDKGYYSEANRGYLRGLEGLEEFCLPQPGLDLEHQSPNATAIQARLLDRRSGIEPLIGHAKQGGQLGKSRMKKDESTLAAGYASIGGFNLRQLIRHLLGKDIKAMA